jgi:chemotaxis protein histidine kinase CheA
MMTEEYIDVQMLCNTFAHEVVEQIKGIREQYIQMDATPDEKDLTDTVFEAAETIKEIKDFCSPEAISHFIHAAETLLALVLRQKLVLHEPSIALLLDTASLIKNALGRLPSALSPGPCQKT